MSHRRRVKWRTDCPSCGKSVAVTTKDLPSGRAKVVPHGSPSCVGSGRMVTADAVYLPPSPSPER